MVKCLNCGDYFDEHSWNDLDFIDNNVKKHFHEDFCTLDCYQAFKKKYPDFDKRDERGRCHYCGSDQLEEIEKWDETVSSGNVLTEDPFVATTCHYEIFKCQSCERTTSNMILGKKLTCEICDSQLIPEIILGQTFFICACENTKLKMQEKSRYSKYLESQM